MGFEAIAQRLKELDKPVSDTIVNKLMGSYLFDPNVEGRMKLNILSGGQKARYQLICMSDKQGRLIDLMQSMKLQQLLHSLLAIEDSVA